MTKDKTTKDMADSVNEREIVLDILLELNRPEAMSHLVIGAALKKYQYLLKHQRSFITRLAQGTLERRIELDYIINQYSKTPVRKMKPLIRSLLEMSVYQLKYMDNVPVSAVCNEAVKLAGKRHFVNLKGFVNGVLEILQEMTAPANIRIRKRTGKIFIRALFHAGRTGGIF